MACLCLVLGFVTPDPWNMRFVQWYPAVLCVALGIVLENLGEILVKRSILLLVTLCAVLNVIGSLNNGWFTLDDWRTQMAVPWREKRIEDVSLIIDQRVPRGEPLAYVIGGNDALYSLYGPDLARPIRYILVPNPREAIVDYRTLVSGAGCRYFYNPSREEGAERRSIFDNQVAIGAFQDLGCCVYRLNCTK